MTLPDRVVAPRPRLRASLGAVVVLVLAAIAVAVAVAAFGPSGVSTTVPPGADAAIDASPRPAPESGPPSGPEGAVVLVHLLGAVARPGLFELRDGARVIDAVAAAGGLTAEADQTQVNLARPLVDGEQLYIPVIGERPPPQAASDTPSATGGTPGGLVDLNTADAALLDTLPGVGPATAKRILDWREANGPFTAVEDLLGVTGIGDKTFAELEPLVTV